jgi:hypothetical protein
LAETAGRDGDADANRKAPLSHRDDLARIAGHNVMFPICSDVGEYALGTPGEVNAKIAATPTPVDPRSLVVP